MPLPHGLDRVLDNRMIHCEYGQMFQLALRNQHPIERIAV
jgi:hypothetical protein